MFGLSTHCPVSHETDVDFPMNLKTQPRVYWTNFMLQNLHEYHWENTPHCAISGTQRLPLLRNQHPRNQCDWSTKIFESIMNSSGAKFAYREPRLEVFKDLERQERKRRAFICDKCTNHRLARPATRLSASASPATSKEPISRPIQGLA